MKKKVLIIDTSILCVWLQVCGMETCGSGENEITYKDVSGKIEKERENGTIFVLPLATIIETGNHITHANGDIYKTVGTFVDLIKASANSDSPWAAFTEQSSLWTAKNLITLADRWKETAASHQSLGDASIVEVAKYYDESGFEVEIFTGDQGLKAYEPETSVLQPRRRR